MAMSRTLHTAAIGALELAINKALELDPATRQRLTRLADHVFLLECSSPELSLYLIPGDEQIRLCGWHEGEADTSLSGSAEEFAKLATAADPGSALINGQLSLHGDSQALIELQKILKHLDLDWEAPLTDLFGDVIGFQLGKGVRAGFRFGQQALAGLKRQLGDFLAEESELVPPRWQVQQFYNDVDQLAMRSERLEARIQKLSSQLQTAITAQQ